MYSFMNYSPVLEFNGIHYCTTNTNVLINFNDLLTELDIKDNRFKVRWKNKIEFEDKDMVTTNRNGCDCEELYITVNAVMLLMTVYAEGIIEDIERKQSVDFTMAGILDEVEKRDVNNKEVKTLSTSYALNALKMNNKIAKTSNNALIDIIAMNKNSSEHKPWFDTEYEIDILGNLEKYDQCLEDIYEFLNGCEDLYVPDQEKVKSVYSLLYDDYDPDTLD